MTSLLRLLPGASFAALVAAAAVMIATYPSRSRLALAEAEAADLMVQDARLVQRLAALKSTVGRVGIPTDLVWTGAQTGSVEIALQQAVVAAAVADGMQLISFGAASQTGGPTNRTIAYELELTGGHVGAARFLADLEAMRPALAVSYLWVRQMPPDQMQSISPVSMRITVWGFRDQEGPAP